MITDDSEPLVGSLAAALLNQGSDLQAISDTEGKLLWANLAFRKRFGSHAPAGCRLPGVFCDAGEPADTAWRDRMTEALRTGQAVDMVVIRDAAAEHAPARAHPCRLQLRIASAANHRLWTLTELSQEHLLKSRLQRLEELLDIAQEFGRLGVWERDLASGKGRWDDHVFRFWGIDPMQGTPSFEDATERIHPDDRSSRQFVDSTRLAGRYSQRFRVIRNDGDLRWLHSHWEIKSSANGTPTHAVGVMVDDSEAVAMARQLSEATAKLGIVVELGEIIIFEHQLRTDYMALNARGCEVLGLPFSDQGTPIDDFERLVHPDDRAEMQANGLRAFTERRPVDMQLRYRHRDGGWRHLLSRRVLQRDASDQPFAFVGVALDVTERVEAQRALEETARALEVATLAAGVGIWSRDTGTGAGQWNAQMFKLFDRDPQLGAPSRNEWLSEMIHPDDHTLLASVPQRLAITPEGTTSEYRVRRADGSTRWLVELARCEAHNGRPMIFGATLDITERKRAELALRQANERIALATRGAAIGTWERDLRTGAVRWDEQMFLLRGLTMPIPADQRSRLAGELRTSLVHPDDVDRIADHGQGSESDSAMSRHEYRVRWPDGSFRWLASRSIPERDDHGHPVRQLGVEWDVHERVMAEVVRREAQVAQRQSEAKAALLARMSHELRTPLNAILGFTDLMAQDPAPINESGAVAAAAGVNRRERLAHIRNAAERLLELVNDVLDLTTIETGEGRLAPLAIDLSALLQEIAALHAQKARVRSVQLRLRGEPVSVFADPTRLRQILSRLVAHHVAMAPLRSELEVVWSRDGNEVRLTIAWRSGVDSAAHQADLLTAAELDSSLNRSDQLADPDLFGAMLAGMNGRIELQPDHAGVERVVLWLPAAKAEKADPPPPADRNSAPPRSARILYIEDNPVNVILVEELVRQRGGIDFCSESNGNTGVGRASRFRPDLILIDIQLPDIDGFEVLRRLRADPETAGTCCVALSANAMPEDVARARAAGFDDYWTKPIRFASFLAGLNRFLPATAQLPPLQPPP